MKGNLELSCKCGTVRAEISDVSPRAATHVICHCDDCLAFARALKGGAEVLDEFGGTRICQTSSGRVRITQGKEALAVLRLSPKGLLRWHSSCCETPLCNTLARPGLPFVGLIAPRLAPLAGDSALVDLIGPVLGRVHTKFANDPAGPPKEEIITVASVGRPLGRIMLFAKLKGDRKRSPFFTASGAPVVSPRLISLEEKARLYD